MESTNLHTDQLAEKKTEMYKNYAQMLRKLAKRSCELHWCSKLEVPNSVGQWGKLEAVATRWVFGLVGYL